MNDPKGEKTEELRKLLQRVQTSGSYESVGLTEKISVLAREVFGRNAAEKSSATARVREGN